MSKRKYPFTEPVPPQPTSTSSGTTITGLHWTTTVYKPNPFRGWRRFVFAFDEWAHRHDLNARGPLRWLCTWWDRKSWDPKSDGRDPGER